MVVMNWYKIAKAYKNPWEMTQDEYVKYHYTGFIDNEAYDSYKTTEGIDWIKKEKKPILLDVKNFGGYQVEFRKDGGKLKYVKHDENDDILRDEKGEAVYLSEQEMIDKKLPLENQSVYAFIGDKPIGFASNEWGSTGIWIVEKYQKLGIGRYLLKEFRKTMPPQSKIGQMTDAGMKLTKAYHKDLVEEAIKEGKPVPEEVLKDYPDLTGGEYDETYWVRKLRNNPITGYRQVPPEYKNNPSVLEELKNIYLKVLQEEPSYPYIPEPIKNHPEILKAKENEIL